MRHTFGTALAEAGVDLAVMQALLGHAHVDTTARYVHLAPTHVKAKECPGHHPRTVRTRRHAGGDRLGAGHLGGDGADPGLHDGLSVVLTRKNP